jgi:hypothetical protein
VASLTAIFMQVISERDTRHNGATHSPMWTSNVRCGKDANHADRKRVKNQEEAQ